MQVELDELVKAEALQVAQGDDVVLALQRAGSKKEGPGGHGPERSGVTCFSWKAFFY